MRQISYLNLKEQHRTLRSQLIGTFARVLDEANFILGNDVRLFEENLAKYCGTKHAVGLNSGTDALFLTLKAYGISPGDEVITVPNSFLATASAIIATGATPIFVDIRQDLNMDPDLIEGKISKKTKAIIPVHLTGKPADMSPILAVAKRYDLRVIEDAAQAIGAEYHGQKTGSIGDAGCFSLHPLKTLNACGDGGAVLTNDPDLFDQLTQLRNIGLKNRNESNMWGFNSRLDSVQAAILNVKLPYLEGWTEARRRNANFYTKHLSRFVEVPHEGNGERSVYHTYVIQTKQRGHLQNYLKKNGIETKIHYPIPIHLQEAARHLGHKKGDCPVSEMAAERILSLPIHEGLTEDDLTFVVKKVQAFFS